MFPHPVLVLPGYGGSGPEHWQSLWQDAYGFTRVEEPDWENPDRDVWVASLEAAVSRSGPGTVLVAHSLACLQVAHWVAKATHSAHPVANALQKTDTVAGATQNVASVAKIRAALLVAPPDPAGPEFPGAARGFDSLPQEPFPFPALVVGSTNDPYASPAFTEAAARAWGAGSVSVGPKGHINAASGLGDWGEGMRLLEALLRE